MPVGAETQPGGGVFFRVWAPASSHVEVIFAENCDVPAKDVPMEKEADGYWSAFVPGAGAGMCYRYKLDSGTFPDPASRFQPEGPHGPSQVIDPSKFAWTDQGWRGVAREGQVIYEMHIGSFTPEGTWTAATEQLPH